MKHILISLIFYLFIGFQIFAEPIILNEKEFTTGNSFSITWETPEEILHPENYQWKEFTGKKIFKSTSNIPYYIVRYKNKDLTNLKNPALMVRKNGFVLKVYSNKEKIFQYSDNSQFKPGQFTGWPTHIIPISKNNQDEYIYFYLYTKMDVLLPTIVIDEEIKLIENIFLTNLPPFIITGISLFLGLGFLIAFFLRRDDFMYLSLFTFFTGIGIWLFQINPISEYFITPSPWKLRVEYFALYMSPVGALLFIESVLPSRLNVILRTLRYFFLIYTIASFSLDFAGIFPLWKTLIPFDIFLLFSIFIFMILIIYGTIKGKWEARLLTIGLVTLVGFAIHDILVVIGVLQTPDLNMHWGMFSFIAAMSGVAIYRIYIMNWHMRMYSKELEEKNIILKLINEEKDNLNNDLEDLNRNLEIKVVERTQEIFDMMEKIKTLKVQQDADYFLTTLIEKPLCKINNDSKIIHVDTFTRQKKAFEFRNKKWELGGDISIVSNLHFSSFDDKYIFFFNGDAMGKSMQGAGGAIVAGTAIHNILNRAYARKRPVRKKPDVWLNEVYNELDSVFRTFEGSMLMSGVIGLIREKTGEVLLINAEHPLSILYKDNRASFIEDSITLHKMGAPIDTEFKMERFNLNKGDSLIIGSDGKDDLELFQENGKLIMNEKETLILEFVEEGKGDLKEIISLIDKRANIIDDISLLKITMT